MRVGIITGSGTHALPDFRPDEAVVEETPYGAAELTRGTLGEREVLHLSRHGAGHARLSNHLAHRANVWALHAAGAEAVLACTVCGAVDPRLELGSLVVFDDLHFLSNRLPDGTLCTFHTESGHPERAHWVLHGGPFSAELRQALIGAAEEAAHTVQPRGTYGHVDGPRFNTPVEIATLAAAGVSAVSQTAGPETVLCGELGLPYALLGFVTDYANQVRPEEPTPVTELVALMSRSTMVFDEVLRGALTALGDRATPAGTILRLG